MIVLSSFILLSTGLIFGFLVSRINTKDFLNLKTNKLEELFSKDTKEKNNNSNIVREKIIQEDSAIIEAVKETMPAVVSIVISKDIPKIQNRGWNPFGDPFGFYFNQEDNFSNETEKQKIGGGTGFILTKDGMIVTNRHVVDDSSADYTVVTNDEKEHSAKVLAVDPYNDIAIIKIEGDNFPTLSLGNSDSVQIGQTVIAIGNSLGEFSNTVSRGIISGLKRNLTAGGFAGKAEKLTNIIQTDAAINPGNSGGPLLNMDKEVIGINVAIAQGAQNIGFAIPSNQIKKVFEQVKETGKISTPFIGIRYISVNKEIQEENNLPYSYGALVARGDRIVDLAVIPGSPADKAGISENDILLEINGEKINEEKGSSLISIINQYNIGDEVEIKLWHKGEEKKVKVTLEEKK